VYLGYWRWFVKAWTEKNEPEQVEKKIAHPRMFLFFHFNLLVAHPCGNAPICSPLVA
jgi:hypothetical protein